MSFALLLRAELKLVYAELFRRKSALISTILYPYLFAGFVLFIGYSFGSAEVFSRKVGSDPALFMITSSFTLMSLLAVVDDILWRPLSDRWIGTLPYIIASPVNRVKLFMAIPIPRLTALLLMGATSVLPLYTYFAGATGAMGALVVIALTAAGSMAMAPFGILLSGVIHTYASGWRALNIVRPIILILVGAYYPRYLMPLIARCLSYLIPASHVVEFVQRMLANALGPDSYLLLAASLATALIYLRGGSTALGRWERRVRSSGVKGD